MDNVLRVKNRKESLSQNVTSKFFRRVYRQVRTALKMTKHIALRKSHKKILLKFRKYIKANNSFKENAQSEGGALL